MRQEQLLAAVTQSLVITAIREIEAVVSFVRTGLYLWLQRMPLGMPAYSGSMSSSLQLGSDMLPGNADMNPNPGSKRGRLHFQHWLALASCPAGNATA